MKRSPDTTPRNTIYKRRAAALGAVMLTPFAVAEGIQAVGDRIEGNVLAGKLEQPFETVQAAAQRGEFEPGKVMTVTIPDTKTSLPSEAAAKLARDDIDMRGVQDILSEQIGPIAEAGEQAILPADQIDPKAVLPDDPKIHVR